MKDPRPQSSSLSGPLRVFAVVAVIGLMASCTDQADQIPTGPAVSESPAAVGDLLAQDLGPAIRAANRHSRALMRNPSVVGTAVALNDDGEPAVRLFLTGRNVPGLPDHLDGIPVQEVVTGQFHLRADRTERARPAPIGFSLGHPDITAGTLGARVIDGDNVYILSNNHILANNNDAQIGDSALQPGPFDGGSDPADAIGTLYDFQPISFSSNNEMDAAIAIVDGADVSGSTPDGVSYGTPSSQTTSASLNMGVQKYGRTTGHTQGTVAELNVTVSVCFETRGPFQCDRAATFVNQISITPGDFSAGGDSGSLIVTQNGNNPVGLLFAGSSTRTLANPIDVVLDRFGVTIDGTEPDGTDPGNGDDGDDGDNGDDGDADISLAVNAYKVRGLQKVDLSWSGATSAQVDIIRDGTTIATVDNSGAYTDHIDRRGGGSYTYRVCEAGTDACSAEATATF